MTTLKQKIQNLEAMKATLAAVASAGNPDAKVALIGIYDLPPLKPVSGKWYFGIKCEECRTISPALPDESHGQRGTPFKDERGALRIRCHSCPNDIQATADEIILTQWT